MREPNCHISHVSISCTHIQTEIHVSAVLMLAIPPYFPRSLLQCVLPISKFSHLFFLFIITTISDWHCTAGTNPTTVKVYCFYLQNNTATTIQTSWKEELIFRQESFKGKEHAFCKICRADFLLAAKQKTN